jgi:glycosyltransferase involved in cell wall biosynthesis
MKLLLVCHALAPGRGSEPGFGWYWAWYLSSEHEVWVLAHPQYQSEVDAYLAVHPNPNLHVVWLKATEWNPTRGMSGFHQHYFRWLRQAEQLARSMHLKTPFDLVHHISLSTISAPPKFWQLGIPFVWGPLGGAQTCPPQLRELFGDERWREWLRLVRLGLLHYYPPFRAAVRNSAALLSTNRETLHFLESAGGRNVRLFLDSGVVDDALPQLAPPRRRSPTVRVLWASAFERRKALPLALEAVALSRGTVPITLIVAGGEERDWMAKAAALGIASKVEFVGKLPPEQMLEEFRRADVFLFTSVRDSFGSVVLEAMGHGLPLVALDLHGVGAFVPNGAGIKVPVGSRAAVVRELSAALGRLAGDPDLRQQMGGEARKFAITQLWSRRAAQMNSLYRQVTSSDAQDPVPTQVQPDAGVQT